MKNAAMTGTPIGTRLRRKLQEMGITANAASVRAGLPRDAVRDIITGKSKHPRSDTIAKIAAALEVEPSYFLDDLPRAKIAHPEEIELPIVFEVAAGSWLAIDEQRDAPLGHQMALLDPEYASIPQWLEAVRGDSMNQLLPDGAIVQVVSAEAMGYAPKHDDVVVVQRSRAQGAFVERSLKQVVLAPGGVELWPRSSNPRWSEPLNYTSGAEHNDDTVVQIVGKVIRAYLRF